MVLALVLAIVGVAIAIGGELVAGERDDNDTGAHRPFIHKVSVTLYSTLFRYISGYFAETAKCRKPLKNKGKRHFRRFPDSLMNPLLYQLSYVGGQKGIV